MRITTKLTVVAATCSLLAGCGLVDDVDLDEPGEPAADVEGVSSTSGDVLTVVPPTSVVPNDNESLDVRVFQERAGYTLPEDLTIQAKSPNTYDSRSTIEEGTLEAGTVVDTYYIHADTDPSGSNNLTGTITFDRDIAAIADDDGMDSASQTLDVSTLTTAYPDPETSGYAVDLTGNDKFTIGSDGRTLTVDFTVYGNSDSMRVVLTD